MGVIRNLGRRFDRIFRGLDYRAHRPERRGLKRSTMVEALESRTLLSVTINGAQLFDSLDGLIGTDADGVHNGVLVISGDLTIKDGGSINANDNWAGSVPNSSATPPIVINIQGSLIIEADTVGALDTGIFAENRNQGGTGANITVDAGTNVIVGNNSIISSADITGGGSNPGAGNIKITADGFFDMQGTARIDASAANGAGGDIELESDGDFTMHSGSVITTNGAASQASGDIDIHVLHGDIDIPTGSLIAAGQAPNSNGPGGAISIITDFGAIDVDGTVVSERGGLTGTGAVQGPGGGPITIIAGARIDPDAQGFPIGGRLEISDTGIVRSADNDAGADLIHLQGCSVTIYGLVESTGVGHALPDSPPNHLNGGCGSHPANSTAGIEVWAGTHGIIIDSVNHNGQLNADLTGGNSNNTWIDLFARGDIQIIGNNSYFSVHATNGGNGATGGQITVTSTEGNVFASGLAFDASAGGSGFPQGGTINIQAAIDVLLNGATLFARGDFNASGGYGGGGDIYVRAYVGKVEWKNGLGDVRPTGIDPPPPPTLTDSGTITLVYNTSIDTTGSSFPTGGVGALPPVLPFPNIIHDDTGTAPTVPDCVKLPTCNFGVPNVDFDFGDAPENPIVPGDYPTTLANDGARHIIVPGFNLGAIVDAETDGQPNGFATGDDLNNDDEDGVIFNGPFVPGLTTSITVTLTNTFGFANPVLNAWFDWNGDGDWLDPGEQVFTDQPLSSGANALNVNVPLSAIVNVAGAATFARFRLENQENTQVPTGRLSTGLAINGEVEDYKLQIFPFWTSKCAVITQIGCFVIPDVLVDVDNGPAIFDPTKVGTLAPATKSIQAAIDYVNAQLNPDLNGDGKVLIAVTAKDTLVQSAACDGIPFIGRDLGGDGYENFIVTNPSGQQLNIMGNSVKIHALDKTKPVGTIQNSNGKITYMDIHVYDSNVDGLLVKNNASYVLVKNTEAGNNKGAGIHIMDNNVEVRGSQRILNNGIGIFVEGDSNKLETLNTITGNTVLGVKITGNSNEASDLDIGLSGQPNAAGILIAGNNNKVLDGSISYNNGYGVKIASGTGNTIDGNDVISNKGAGICVIAQSSKILENNVFLNTGNGIDVTGNSNTVQKNNVGDKNKGNTGDGIRVAGNSNIIDQNGVYSNSGDGIEIVGDSNQITKNIVGDKSKGGNGLGNVAGNKDGIRITGKNNTADGNTTNANKGYGIYIAGATSTGNAVKNHKSNTESSGGASENAMAEYKFDALVTVTGNKKDNANFATAAIGTYE